MFKLNEKVNVLGVGAGFISSIRKDDLGNEIYTILLENSELTPDGLYYARACEILSMEWN